VRQTIQSILDQDYQNLELIVMDGCSTDETHEILSGFDGVQVFIEPDSSVEEAIQNGIHKSTAELIMFMMISDSYADQQWISRCVQVMEQSPDIALCWGLPQYMSEDGVIGKVCYQKWIGGKAPSREAMFRHWLKTGWYFPECNMCIRREVIEKLFLEIDNTDPSIDIWLEFSKRFHITGYLSEFIPMVANYGRLHSGNRTQLQRATRILDHQENNYHHDRLAYARRVLWSSNEHRFRALDGSISNPFQPKFGSRILISLSILITEGRRILRAFAIRWMERVPPLSVYCWKLKTGL